MPLEPYPHTLLSLKRYAQILGLNPLHFAGALTPGLDPQVYPSAGCSSVWHKYDWQNYDQVSLYQIAQLIHDAEHEVANYMGYYPAPYWIESEEHSYPDVYLKGAEGNGLGIDGRPKSVIAKRGKMIAAGRRAVSLIDTATVAGGALVYTDEDGDGFYETATITVATTYTNPKLIKVYFADQDGSLDWEVKPVRSKTISGGNVVIVLDAWLLIDPDLYELPPNTGEVGPPMEAIDVSTIDNYVTEVEIYLEYVDATLPSAVFYWAGDGALSPLGSPFPCPTCGIIGCTACSYASQNGCGIARSLHNGELTVYPATYDADDGAWSGSSWTYCVEPDLVKVYYLSGDQSQEYLQGRSTDPLSHFWAQIITWIATARIDRPLCGCGDVQAIVDDLRTDLTFSEGGSSYFVSRHILDSPFGTRKGEVKAWLRLSKLAPQPRRMAPAMI